MTAVRARTVAVLGAGAMGSALATPFRARGHEVRLWGTWLDDHLLEACRQGKPHPRTGVRLAEGTKLFDAGELADAVRGAELVVLAVASVGVAEVVSRLAATGAEFDALLLTSKGFAEQPDGRIVLLPDAVRALYAERPAPAVIAVGGPCKANEVAAGRPTAAVFGSADVALARRVAADVATPAYRAEATSDEVGVEICAPMKNVYAIALGVADGLAEQGGQPWHDLKAAAFTQAIREISLITTAAGGRAETATGLAGVGDLEVTGLSGRNRLYGWRIGTGEPAPEALAVMAAAEQTVEGVSACALASALVDQLDPTLWERLPLLRAIQSTVDGAAGSTQDITALITEAALPRG